MRLYLKHGSRQATNLGLWAAEREDAGRSIVHADQMRTTFRELQAAIYRQFEPQMEIHAYLHVLLSAQIKIGHATAWMRTRICASFMLRASLLSFGFAPWFARILRETFTEKPNDAPSSLSVRGIAGRDSQRGNSAWYRIITITIIKKEASALVGGDTLGNHR